MRDSLIELLGDFPVWHSTLKDRWMPEAVDKLASHLLANGVIVPPCKVGDKLYNADSLIDEYCYWEVERIEIYADERWIIDDSENHYLFDEIGKTVFLTREEAEAALAERSSENAE